MHRQIIEMIEEIIGSFGTGRSSPRLTSESAAA
jgi:hypothetical protein